MALEAKAGQLTGPTTTGDVGYSVTSFTPKALIGFGGLQTANGGADDAHMYLGVASSNSTERGAGYISLNGAASSDVSRVFTTTRLIRSITAGAATTQNEIDLTSFNSDGFTLGWDTVNFNSQLLNYLTIGGDDITNVSSGSFAANTSNGIQSITGLGFKPDIVLLFETLQTGNGAANSNSCYSIGVSDGTNQWSVGVGVQNNQATTNNRRNFSNDRIIALPSAGSNIYDNEATLDSFTSDGFDINWVDAPGFAHLVGYIAIKGGSWKVGTDTQKTSTGTKATSGVGFQPKGVILSSHCDTTTNSVIDNARMVIGVATSSSENMSSWIGDSDNVPDAIADSYMSNTKCLVMATEGTPTVNAEAELDSFDSDGFTLDWTTADATARVFGYVAFGDTGGGGGHPLGSDGTPIGLLLALTYSSQPVVATTKKLLTLLGVG